MLRIEISSNSDLITSRWCVEQVKNTFHFLLFQRLQIPVPYPTLKLLVDRLRENREETVKINFFLEKQRNLAIETFDKVEQLIGSLERLIITRKHDLEYAAITFGASPILSKEVWFMRLPAIDREHKNENHIANLQSIVGQTILTLIQDDNFGPAFSSNLQLTNINILVKGLTNNHVESEDQLEEMEFLQLPKSCKTFLIDLTLRNQKVPEFVTCKCIEREIQIYDDEITGLAVQCSQMSVKEEEIYPTTTPMDTPTLEGISSGSWFRLTSDVKGFKDDTRNGQKIWIC